MNLISIVFVFFFQAEDGIRDLVRSRGLGDVYKRQVGPASSRRQRVGGWAGERLFGGRVCRRRPIVRGLSLIHI